MRASYRLPPWPIPATAIMTHENKHGYRQVKYTWTAKGWRYVARWHEKTPLATLIDYPSWRLERIRPGKGFGPDAAPKIEQTRVDHRWLPSRQVRYYARQLNHHLASNKMVDNIYAAHPAAVVTYYPKEE